MFDLLRIFIILSVLFGVSAEASGVAIDISKPQYKIGKSIDCLEDADNEWNLDEVSRLPKEFFRPIGSDVFEHSFTSSTFYFRFEVVNKELTEVNRLLVFGVPWLDKIKVRIESPSKKVDDYLTGDEFPFDMREIEYRYPNVEHRFEHGVSTVYVEVKTRDPFIVPVSIMDRETLFNEQIFDLAFTAFIYGMVLVMALYHLVLFISIRFRYYGYYVLYLLTFLLMNASYNGYTFHLFTGNYPETQNWLVSSTIYLFSIAGLLFYKAFLNLKKTIPWAHHGINILLVLFVAIAIISAFFGYRYHMFIAIMLTMIFGTYGFIISLLSYLKGNYFARFFMFGKVWALIGGIITVLSVMAVIPYTDLGLRALEFGMVLDSTLLAFAMIDRVKENEREREAAEILARTDLLTGLANRRAYEEIGLELVETMKRQPNAAMTAMMIDIDFFKKVNDTYGHSAGDIVLKRVARALQNSLKESDYIFRLGGEEFLVLLPKTAKKQAELLAERIRTTVEEMQIELEDSLIQVSISIGVCEYHPDHDTISQTEKIADKALYVAKQLGRNRVIVAP